MKIHDQLQGAVTVLRPEGPLIENDATVLKARLLQTLAREPGRAFERQQLLSAPSASTTKASSAPSTST